MRFIILGADGCKQRAQQLVKPTDTDKVYAGLAAMQASEIRRVARGLCDSREEFLGHADIKVIGREVGEPPSPENLRKIREMSKALVGIAKYHVDPSPSTKAWSGPELLPP